MSVNDRIKANEPAAAPLRAKIAQFESKGGVPVPRGKFDSFGSAAPPPQQNKQRRELYGNRMKPVWVPSAKVGPASLTRTRDERREARRAMAAGEGGVVDHLPSPPESPPAESDHGSGPSSPASIVHQQQFTIPEEEREPEHEQEAEQEDVPTPPKQEYVYEIPAICGAEDSDEEDVEEEEVVEDPIASPLPSPAIDDSPPAIPIKTEPEQIPPSPFAVDQPPSSPPLPPSPPLSPTDAPVSEPDELLPTIASRVDLHVDTGYGTIKIQAPPRTSSSPTSSPLTDGQQSFTFSHRQGQSFTSVVHPRVRETPARTPIPTRPRREHKRLPPAPPSPGYTNRLSNADLTVLVANAAALERRLVAGELPTDVLRRLSVRPALAPMQNPAPVVEERSSRSSRRSTEDAPEQAEKKHHGFRNPLKRVRSRSRKREHKDDHSDSSSQAHAESTWFGDVSWRKLASTSRHKSPLESAQRTLISTP